LPSEHAVHQVGGGGCPQDPGQLAGCLVPVQTGQLQALDRAASVQLGQKGSQPLLARLVVAVGDHQHQALPAEVSDQERQQVTGRLVGPVQILHHQDQWGLLDQLPQQPEQQLKQAGLGRLVGWASTTRLTQGG
jgi:hypothetical protein